MKIINLTPHNVRILAICPEMDGDKDIMMEHVADFPSVGVARCKVESEQIDSISCPMVDIPIRRISYGEIEGLPEPETGVYYVVSRLVKQAVPGRMDCLVPDDMIRDKEGKILGCTGFAL